MQWIVLVGVITCACRNQPNQLGEGGDTRRGNLHDAGIKLDGPGPIPIDAVGGNPVAELAQPLLLSANTAVPRTLDGELANRMHAAIAVAVVRATAQSSFLVSSFPLAQTAITLEIDQVLAGEPPTTVFLLGGTVNGVTYDSAEEVKLPLAVPALAFFIQTSYGVSISFADRMVGSDEVTLMGQPVDLAYVQAYVSQTVGAQ